MATSVTDLVWIDSAGYHFADFPTFQNYLIAQYQSIYGADVYLGSDSQDGQWLGIVSQALYDTAAVGSSIYNSFSPSTAQGVGLSRNVKINGLRRQGATFSTVQLTIVGTAFTTITNGVAVDGLNQQWNLPASVTIPGGGTITVTATSAVAGNIAALPGTITGIYTPTQGWQTVNNAAAATAGQAAETDAALRVRQAISTAIPAQTVLDAMLGAVANVSGVTAFQGYENDTDSPDSNGLPEHSVAIVVSGGTSTTIAQTILQYKTPGTKAYGTTNVPLTDAKGVPITIGFFYATQARIAVQVTLTPLAAWVSSNETIISNALAAFINSVGIGDTIVLTQLYGVAYVPGTSAAGSFLLEEIQLAVQPSGYIELTANPSASDTVTVNGVTITFVSSSPTGNQVLIGTDAPTTALALQTFLAASSSGSIDVATYAIDTSNNQKVDITYIVPGPIGDSFTLAESSTAITLSGATLTGGGWQNNDIDLVFNDQAICETTDIEYIT